MFKQSVPMVNFYAKRLLSLKPSAQFDWTTQMKILMAPYEYTLKAPCKFLALTGPAFNHWLQAPAEKLRAIQEAIPNMSAWTILLDDIQDKSEHRYGIPSAYQIFGAGLTINAANKVLLLGQKQIADLGHPLAPEILLTVHEEYFCGQGIDIYWSDNYIIPTEDEHIEMARKKGGAWFTLPVKLLQLFSSNTTDHSHLAYNIGIYHHVVDDYYNLFEPNKLWRLAKRKQANHTTCSDVEEGKITLALIHASQFPDVADELADIYKQRTSDPKLHERVISLLKKHGSDEYMKNALNSIEAEIRTEIDRLGGNPPLTKYMDELCLH